jgi:small subunit ribosomal protein S8
MTDPVADFLTRIRNAVMAGHKVVEAPASSIKKDITRILFEKGYILSYKFLDEEGPQGTIKIALKYEPKSHKPAIKGIDRISRPGLRKYSGVDEIPRVLNGLGIAIISTSKGLMTDKEAKNEKVGGEILCYVY